MTSDQKQLIKATIPVLKEHGLLLIMHFYQRVFAQNPELKNVFNQANQQAGRQPMALATAVLAYAEHIDDPSVLGPTLTRIGHKHTSLNIRPEHYPVVGHHLLASIGEVLGDAATPELLDAWGAAYHQLADLMIDTEAGLYAAQVDKPGGWRGWRSFVVKTKIAESDGRLFIHLYPADGGPVAEHQPGQYLSLRLYLPELNLHQPHQYRILNTPNSLYYRISVKREPGKVGLMPEMVRNRLHNVIQDGGQFDVSAPAGASMVPIIPKKSAAAGNMSGCPMHQAA